MDTTRLATVLCAAGLALLAMTGCRATAVAKAANNSPDQRLTVAVATAEMRPMERTAQVQGALYPRERTTLAANVDGAVVQVAADFGDRAKEGQVLMRIDPREYQLRLDSAGAAVDQARARLENSRARFDRAQELRKQELISQQEFDQSAATLRVDEADADSAVKAAGLAHKKLDDTIIRAPFSGSVQKRMASLGQYVTVGTQLYELIATDPIKLRCPMPERFVPLAHPGMPVRLTIDAQPDLSYTGTITRIAPALDDQSRTLLVEAEVPNPQGTLKPGYFAHVAMDLGRDQAVFVPETAVLRYAGVARVFVVVNGIAHSREVKTGTLMGNQIEITEGLSSGERIIVSEVDRLADGTRVVAREAS
ncbi:MAG: efflux RND transporter periplasmic adaptor subunit [Deltaproteobacteria bacterium]|jgi:membrane fusion protein, multidrug efflux system|nr:efflux RND transporter periplasmic adaptor subunit [Deltaproteobacteria bacterium]